MTHSLLPGIFLPVKICTMPRRPRPRSIGAAVKAARLAKGWSQARLARLLEVPEATVQNWESGRTEPRFTLYARMCLLFGWPLPYAADSGNSVTPEYLAEPSWPRPLVVAAVAAVG